MEISKDLRTLSNEFKKRDYSLYITGGYVRDSLLGLESNDIDLTSNAPYSVVVNICRKLKLKCVPINKNLGTLKIITNAEEYEYTQFRKESYSKGNHTPDEVIFVDDIAIDAQRRDITINSLYYHIDDDRIIDLVHGQKDLENHIIRTTNTPSITLQDDGLRILRVIRFASLLNFQIEKNTKKYLRLYLHKLRDISKERILKELIAIMTCDTKHKLKNHIALETFNQLKIYQYIFNSAFKNIVLKKSEIISIYSLSLLGRLMGLYMMILKKYCHTYMSQNQIKFSINLMLGKDGIKESNTNIMTLEKLYLIYQNLEHNIDIINATINYLTLSDTEKEIILAMLSSKPKYRLSDNISFIKSKNLPLGIHELNITPQDLIDNKINNNYIRKILMTLFNQVIEMKVLNNKEELLKLAIDINETFTNIAKQLEGEKNENNILPSRRKSSQPQKAKKPRR